MNENILCNLQFEYEQTAERIVEDLRCNAQADGGEFCGDTQSGKFKLVKPVTISGEYQFESAVQSINIQITGKPFYVSCGKIQNELARYFAGGDLSNILINLSIEPEAA